MRIAKTLSLGALVFLSNAAWSETLLSCGASKGQGFFFKHSRWNPNGPEWASDAISNGKIILKLVDDRYDIAFDDIVGSHSYRADGAELIKLAENDQLATFGVFHPNYTDVYTFDFVDKHVAWSSHKIGFIPKASTYYASCD